MHTNFQNYSQNCCKNFADSSIKNLIQILMFETANYLLIPRNEKKVMSGKDLQRERVMQTAIVETNFQNYSWNHHSVEEDKITPFLAVTLICDTVQAEGIQILRPDPGSSDWEVYDPDVIS